MTLDKLVFDIPHIRYKPSENPGFYNVDGGCLRTSNNMKSIILGTEGPRDRGTIALSPSDLHSVGELELIVAI